MQRPKQVFRSSQSYEWTRERVERLRKPEIEQLRDNAGKLGASEVVVLCEEALRTLPKGGARGPRGSRQPKRPRRLVSRIRAFEARGVWLQDPRVSWGGVRKSDGAVVLGIWAEAIESGDGSCRYLLWAPNAGGARPWSDKAGGKERLEHCKLAVEASVVEALLVYGETMEGYIPEDRTRSVHGVDPETVVSLKVERAGEEYWAVWGKKARLKHFKVGKYDIRAQPAAGSAHMFRYTVMLNGKRLGALLSMPAESDCRFLESPPKVPPLKIFQVTFRPGRPKKGTRRLDENGEEAPRIPWTIKNQRY